MNPIKDLKVVELASVLAGPTVGTFFAELGAKVIKFENKTIGGDVTRNWKTQGEGNGISAYYSAANFNKQVVFANLKDEEDRKMVLSHLESADILITNFKYGDNEKLGFDYNTLKKKFPKLIVGEVRGFANDKERVAYDVVLQAETGFMSMNGTPTSGPIKMPVAMMDLLAAHQLKEGLLVALLQREKTKKGSLVYTTLEESGIATLANQASNFLMNGKVAQPIGSLHPNIAPYGETFTCKDKQQVVLAIGSDRQFQLLCEIAGNTQLAFDSHFKTNPDRVTNRAVLQQKLSNLISQLNSQELLQKCHSLHVPVAAVKTIDQVLNSETGKEMILEELIEETKTRRVKTIAFNII
ncbi:MAG: CoA transferase [Schleiferiaceae bacterium]|nr:CoA transferase [Schleiferiaceae bacterium]